MLKMRFNSHECDGNISAMVAQKPNNSTTTTQYLNSRASFLENAKSLIAAQPAATMHE